MSFGKCVSMSDDLIIWMFCCLSHLWYSMCMTNLSVFHSQLHCNICSIILRYNVYQKCNTLYIGWYLKSSRVMSKWVNNRIRQKNYSVYFLKKLLLATNKHQLRMILFLCLTLIFRVNLTRQIRDKFLDSILSYVLI